MSPWVWSSIRPLFPLQPLPLGWASFLAKFSDQTMTTNKWILTGTTSSARPPARVLSGPLGLSAYRHKNLANRTVIDLMVFLFKKKKKEKKGKRQAKSKNETREISYWKALWHARYTHSDTHTHTARHTRVSLWPRKGQDQPQPQPEDEDVSMCAPQSRPLNCKSSQMKKRTDGNSNKNGKWFIFPLLFLFAFWESAGLGPEGGAWNLAVCRFRGVDGL